jgi:2-keto-3-deoxy-6-phosphogluconate aldolase
MPKYVVINPKVTINGTNVSPSVAAATLELTATDVDVTSFGSNGWTEIISGLKSGTVSLDFHSGYAAGEINTVLNPLIGTLATVVINPNGTATSSTNPAWTATVHVNTVSPVAGAVGDLATFSVSYPTSGSVTFATA